MSIASLKCALFFAHSLRGISESCGPFGPRRSKFGASRTIYIAPLSSLETSCGEFAARANELLGGVGRRHNMDWESVHRLKRLVEAAAEFLSIFFPLRYSWVTSHFGHVGDGAPRARRERDGDSKHPAGFLLFNGSPTFSLEMMLQEYHPEGADDGCCRSNGLRERQPISVMPAHLDAMSVPAFQDARHAFLGDSWAAKQLFRVPKFNKTIRYDNSNECTVVLRKAHQPIELVFRQIIHAGLQRVTPILA
ncbi:hypothetical protein [Paraburkholderia azotifigens]|uniref:hypothetical protein n=1 Tax=Paraburkholderia azotifigens TaxID=2057004 RepID=UPI0038B9D3EB